MDHVSLSLWLTLCSMSGFILFYYKQIWNRVDCRRSIKRSKNTRKVKKKQKNRFLIRQNKTGCEFSRKFSFSKLRTIQKETIYLSVASWILAEEKGRETLLLFCLIKKCSFQPFSLCVCFWMFYHKPVLVTVDTLLQQTRFLLSTSPG